MDVVATVGEKVSFEVTAVGANSYQWQYSPDNGNTWKTNWASSVTGSKTSKITLPVKSSSLKYQFRCVITGKDGSQIKTNSVKIIKH